MTALPLKKNLLCGKNDLAYQTPWFLYIPKKKKSARTFHISLHTIYVIQSTLLRWLFKAQGENKARKAPVFLWQVWSAWLCFQLGRKKAAQETEETLTKCGMENKYQRRRTLALMKHQLYDSVITVMCEGLLTLLFFSLFFLIQHKVGWIHIITNEMFGRFQAEIAQPDTQLNFLLSPNITSAWQNIDLKTSNIIMNWHEDICRLYLHGVKGMNTSKGHFLNNFKQEYENQKKKIVREIQETCNDC